MLHDRTRSVKRAVYLVKDNQPVQQLTFTKVSQQNKRFLSKRNSKKFKSRNLHSVCSTLEEGEIRSDIEASFANATNGSLKIDKDDDTDCVIVEPTLEEITLDDRDDDIPSTSEVSTNYQSIMNSFKERLSSTPCHSLSANTAKNNDNKYKTDNDILPFFIDVNPRCGTESINSTDNFTDSINLSTLSDKSFRKCSYVSLKKTITDVEVIELDDVSQDSTDITLKPQFNTECDDSVIFVSETHKTDFIPIENENTPSHKVLKISETVPKTPANKLRTNNLFTYSEKKKLNEYNENAYNPSHTDDVKTGKRVVIIDGSNVAFKHGLDQKFSVKGLKIALEYFEKLGHEVKAVIPQFRMNKTKSTNPDELERLHKAGKIVQTPCKNLPGHTSTSYDDRFILQLAFAMDAAIVSNDNYRDLLYENPAFRKIVENRVIGYTWCNDIFILPKDPYGKWGPSLHTILNH